MRKLMFFIAAVAFAPIFVGCNADGESSSAAAVSSESDVDKSIGSATFILDNGVKIDYKAALNTGSSRPVSGFGIGLSDHKITVIAQYGNKEPLAVGGNFDGYISVYGISRAGRK